VPEADWLVRGARALKTTGSAAIEGAVLPWGARDRDRMIRNLVNRDGGRYMTANMMYERELFDELGGFDPRFDDPPFLEDSDLAFRVLDHGVRIPFRPEVRVRHRDVELTPRRYVRETAKLQWMPLLAAKHPRRYRSDLRPKVQALRPGDLQLLSSLAASVALRRAPLGPRLLAWAWLALSARRVIRSAGIEHVPRAKRFPWILAALTASGTRAFHLARGGLRFRKLAL
jgi:GT2 family glycosyltransferase